MMTMQSNYSESSCRTNLSSSAASVTYSDPSSSPSSTSPSFSTPSLSPLDSSFGSKDLAREEEEEAGGGEGGKGEGKENSCYLASCGYGQVNGNNSGNERRGKEINDEEGCNKEGNHHISQGNHYCCSRGIDGAEDGSRGDVHNNHANGNEGSGTAIAISPCVRTKSLGMTPVRRTVIPGFKSSVPEAEAAFMHHHQANLLMN